MRPNTYETLTKGLLRDRCASRSKADRVEVIRQHQAGHVLILLVGHIAICSLSSNASLSDLMKIVDGASWKRESTLDASKFAVAELHRAVDGPGVSSPRGPASSQCVT